MLTHLYSTLGILVEQPLLAFLPAVAILLAAHNRRSRLATTMGIIWIVYALYELGMRNRILCSGDCNIRIDLLVIYPILVLCSLVAVVAVLRASASNS